MNFSKPLFSALIGAGVISAVHADWPAYYSSPTNYATTAEVKTDSTGNVYVLGNEKGSDNTPDWTLVKYDRFGNQKWVKNYAGSGSAGDQAIRLAIGTGGSIYASGIVGNGASYDIGVVCYSPAGVQQWTRFLDGTGRTDYPFSLVADANGGVVVAGVSSLASGNLGLLVAAYDSGGNTHWSRLYLGTGLSLNCRGLALDSSNNVYVTGDNYATAGNIDFLTAKFDGGNGNLDWVKTYDSGHGNDGGRAIAVDPSGHVIVGGYAQGTTNSDYFTLAYDSNGNKLWQDRHNAAISDDSSIAMAVDTDGSAYLTGNANEGGNYKLMTVKIDSTGHEVWTKKVESKATSSSKVVSAVSVAVGNDGSIYVTGTQTGDASTTHYEFETVKYSPAGSRIWTKFETNGATEYFVAGCTFDLFTSKLYVTGYRYNFGTGASEILTVKY